MPEQTSKCAVAGVNGNIVTIDFHDLPIMKNEVAHILVGDRRLKSEVLRIRGASAEMQVFEDTAGIKVGDAVELSGEMLSVSLGPGLLGTIYDGLQKKMDEAGGVKKMLFSAGMDNEGERRSLAAGGRSSLLLNSSRNSVVRTATVTS